MNSTLKLATVLAATAILCFGAIAQTSDETRTKTCCKGKGDKANCCKSEACQQDEAVAIATAPVSSDGLSVTIPCGCCKQGGASVTAPIILALDIDKDGIVSATEMKNATQSLLALDKNQDGKLDRNEMARQFRILQGERLNQGCDKQNQGRSNFPDIVWRGSKLLCSKTAGSGRQ